ncbi:MAG TPA: hypothetical protein DCX06_05635 [Opitutae bacterium]|nr:hypothetical protein [Opitutae bacterium]
MRWLFRITLSLIFLGLLTLASLPYLPTLKQKANRFMSTWQQLQSQEPLDVPASDTHSEASKAPRRSIVSPESGAIEDTEEEPMLAEARRRAEEDPESAMAWLQSQPNGPLRLRGMLEVVALWAAEDSEDALLWLETNAQGIARLETLNSGIEMWAQQDPQAASAWIEGMANDGSKLTATKALASNWVKSNPNEASQWVGNLPNGALRDEAAAALIESWAETQPDQAAIWALSEAEFNGNVALVRKSIEHYTETATDDAEQFVREIAEVYEEPMAVDTFVLTRAKNDPADTMNWYGQLPSNDLFKRAENARIIMSEWSHTDSVAASSWLNTQEAGPDRDAAIIGFNDSMLKFEPEVATLWANSITAPETRVEQLTASIQTWALTQPQEALEWVKTAELDPDLRTSLASEIGAD